MTMDRRGPNADLTATAAATNASPHAGEAPNVAELVASSMRREREAGLPKKEMAELQPAAQRVTAVCAEWQDSTLAALLQLAACALRTRRRHGALGIQAHALSPESASGDLRGGRV